MAPELIKGQKHSYEVDVWALGVLLYEMLHGYSPFDAAKEADKCHKIVNCKFEVDNFVSSNAKDLIKKMIQAQPADRIRLKEALNHPFFSENFNENNKTLVGACFRAYVQNYGMDEGVVEEINGNECVVFFKKSGSKEVLSLDEVERRLKRAKLGGKKEVVEENKNFKQEKDENKESSAENLRSVAKIAEKYEKKAGKMNNISEENKFPEKNLEKTRENVLKIAKNYEKKVIFPDLSQEKPENFEFSDQSFQIEKKEKKPAQVMKISEVYKNKDNKPENSSEDDEEIMKKFNEKFMKLADEEENEQNLKSSKNLKSSNQILEINKKFEVFTNEKSNFEEKNEKIIEKNSEKASKEQNSKENAIFQNLDS